MKDLNYWSSYNENLLKLNDRILKYNDDNSFNYIEESFYNHIRDILALVILKLGDKKPLNILDYGSNIITWSNLKNKINIDNLKIYLFDPFYFKKHNIFNENIEIFSNFEVVDSKNFDLTIFGSSSQYIENFYDLLESKQAILSNNLLFTHTPFSTKESFKSLQFTSYKGFQYVRSIDKLTNFLKEKSYEIVFKSAINKDYASVEKKYLDQTIYANILFSRNLKN
jgi:hypothetical protein